MNASIIKKAGLALVTIVIAASAQFNIPQNARRDAMANAPMPDMIDVYRYPSIMTGYTDHLQATWGGGVIGIKAVNDVVSVGIIANQGLMAPRFADAAVGRVNGYTWGAAPGNPSTFNQQFNIPHLLVGFDLGAMSIGVDFFFEYAGYSGVIEGPSGTAGAGDYKGSITHPGTRVSATLDLGTLELLVKGGMGFLGASAESPGNPKLGVHTGIYMEGGAELGLPMDNIDLTVGADYTRADHRFEGDNTTECNSRLAVYVSGEFNFVETAAAILSYTFLRNARTATQDVGGNPSTTEPASHLHVFTAGLENGWDKAWIFDAAHLRGGLRYTTDLGIGKTHTAANVDTRWSNPGVHTGITPTLGVGVSKAFFDLDLSVDMSGWNGLFIGPPVTMVTGTIKF